MRTFSILFFIRNILTRAYLHICTLSRNLRSHASARIRACALAIILACNYVCLFFHACASANIRSSDPARICACSGCSVCISFVISKKLLWGDLCHGSKTDHLYIRGDFRDSFYHRPESTERCSLQWLGEGICKHLSCQAVFQWQVPIINTILDKEV